MVKNRHIPEHIKRVVRQLCRYHCLFCNELFCHYEHIVPFSECNSHDIYNIVLLCARHHQEVTSGRIGKNQVYQAYKRRTVNPENRILNHSLILSKVNVINIGNVAVRFPSFPSYIDIICIDDETRFSIANDFDITLYNLYIIDCYGKPLVKIINNEIVINNNGYDISYKGKFLRIRRASQSIFKAKIEHGGLAIIDASFLPSSKTVEHGIIGSVLFDKGGATIGGKLKLDQCLLETGIVARIAGHNGNRINICKPIIRTYSDSKKFDGRRYFAFGHEIDVEALISG